MAQRLAANEQRLKPSPPTRKDQPDQWFPDPSKKVIDAFVVLIFIVVFFGMSLIAVGFYLRRPLDGSAIAFLSSGVSLLIGAIVALVMKVTKTTH